MIWEHSQTWLPSNAVRVEEMSIYDKNTGGPFPIPGPLFIVADTIKPLSYDFVENKLISHLGTGQFTGGSFIIIKKGIMRQTSRCFG